MLYYAVSNLWGGLNVMYYYLLYKNKTKQKQQNARPSTIKLHEDGNLT
jgi:hypothetical protein